jgi:hypothetical protein
LGPVLEVELAAGVARAAGNVTTAILEVLKPVLDVRLEADETLPTELAAGTICGEESGTTGLA